MTNNVSLTFSVGDSTLAAYNSYWARKIELVSLNIRFSVVLPFLYNLMAGNYGRGKPQTMSFWQVCWMNDVNMWWCRKQQCFQGHGGVTCRTFWVMYAPYIVSTKCTRYHLLLSIYCWKHEKLHWEGNELCIIIVNNEQILFGFVLRWWFFQVNGFW